MSRSALTPGRFIRLTALAALTAAAIAADTATKAVVEAFPPIDDLPFVYLIHNPSNLMGAGGEHPVLVLVLSAVVLMLVGWWVLPLVEAGALHPVGPALVLGGASANLVDRLLHGEVTDFIDLGWLIVNVADFEVIIGVALLIGSRAVLAPAGRVAAVGSFT